MEAKRVFAADIGASEVKCYIGTFAEGRFDISEIHRFSHEAVPFFLSDRNGEAGERMYWNELSLYQNILWGLGCCRREVSSVIESIGIDTWGSDGCFVTEDGDSLGGVYCYRDHRLDGIVEKLQERIDARRMYEITGIHFLPFNISGQLFWFFSNRKELFRPGCRFFPMPTLFSFYLGGTVCVDSTWASITQLMDVRKKRWSGEVLGGLGIPETVMPPIVPPGTVTGSLTEMLAVHLHLNRAKLVSVGSHDTASAYAAAPVEHAEQALIISSGTWSLIGRLIPEPITTDEAMAARISNEGGIGNIRFLKNCVGTWIVQELRRVWKADDGRELGWEEVTNLVRRSPAFTSFIDTDHPTFYNPSNMETAIRDYCDKTGQPVPSDRGSCLRVVYESLAMKYRAVNEEISEVIGIPSTVIHIVGGGSKNELLNQFTSDATGLPVVAGPEEATAIGNIMVQALGLGIISDLSIASPLIRQRFRIERYRPQRVQQWASRYRDYRRILAVHGR
jgi:rhamnulokinase